MLCDPTRGWAPPPGDKGRTVVARLSMKGTGKWEIIQKDFISSNRITFQGSSVSLMAVWWSRPVLGTLSAGARRCGVWCRGCWARGRERGPQPPESRICVLKSISGGFLRATGCHLLAVGWEEGGGRAPAMWPCRWSVHVPGGGDRRGSRVSLGCNHRAGQPRLRGLPSKTLTPRLPGGGAGAAGGDGKGGHFP